MTAKPRRRARRNIRLTTQEDGERATLMLIHVLIAFSERMQVRL